jgi:Ca-activated chloride channel family protein
VVGRRRASGDERSWGVTGTVMVSALVLIAAGSATRLVCTGQLTLTVHAQPVVAPALRVAGDRLRGSRSAVDGRCIDVVVHDRDPAAVAAQAVQAASGQAEASDLPDVWVPDSSVWLDLVRARAPRTANVPATGVSVASSPVVIAVMRPVAAQLRAGGWGRLLDRLSGPQPLVVGMPDPTSSAVGIAALHGLSGALTRQKAPAGAATATWRALAVNIAASVNELARRVPGAAARPGVQAFPADEATVWRFNGTRPRVPLVATYPADGAIQLDYPYVVLRGAEVSAKSQAAQALLADATSDRGDADLFAAGLRLPDGTASRQFGAARGVTVRTPQPAKRPPGARTEQLLRQWTVANLNGRTLVLLDVSGSMGALVPGTNATRMELTVRAAREGLGLFEDDDALGVWVFSTRLTRTTDYREMIPIGRLSERLGRGTRRSEIIAALDRLPARPRGGTGLYDTIQAAHRKVRGSYDPARVNSVVVLTDGRNDDARSVTLARLLQELRSAANPRRPVPVITIALGPDVDMRALQQVAQVTGGATFRARDPRQINRVFFDAISLRSCRPKC